MPRMTKYSSPPEICQHRYESWAEQDKTKQSESWISRSENETVGRIRTLAAEYKGLIGTPIFDAMDPISFESTS